MKKWLDSIPSVAPWHYMDPTEAAFEDARTWTPAKGRAKSDAVVVSSTFFDPDLAALIEAWPSLPVAIKASILLMVKDGSTTEKEAFASENSHLPQ